MATVHQKSLLFFALWWIGNHRTALNRQIKEAVRIRRRGGATSILNSKAEYNRCYIPRLVVEVEDEEAMNARKTREEEEIKELQRVLDEDDMSWEIRKQREQELGKKKRRRQSETEDEPGPTGRRVSKKLKFGLLTDDWGMVDEADDDRGVEEGVERQPVPVLPRGDTRRQVSSPTILTSRYITDFYKPALPVIMEGVHDEIVWEEDEFFDAVTTPLRDLRSGDRPRRGEETAELTADVNSTGKLVDWWGSLYEEQDDYDELVMEYLTPQRAPPIAKEVELIEDDIWANEDDLEDDLLYEGSPEDQGSSSKGLMDYRDASQCEDPPTCHPHNMVEDKRDQDIPDQSEVQITQVVDTLFPQAGETTTSVDQAGPINSFVQSGQFDEDPDTQGSEEAGVNDKESTAMGIVEEPQRDDDEESPGNSGTTMGTDLGTVEGGQLTPSMDTQDHLTDKSKPLPSNNPVVLLANEDDLAAADNLVADPVCPPPPA